MTWHFRHGTTADGLFALSISPEQAGWGFSGLRVLELPAGGNAVLETEEDELIVLPLAGGCAVTCDDVSFAVHGREGVFAGVTDFVYCPRDARVRISTVDGGRFALPSAKADRSLPARYVAADNVPVQVWGAGVMSRQVNAFCAADVFDADRLIALEVITPSGNWSSYPPHKHDELLPGEETVLEELYYYEVAGGGFAHQRAYSAEPGREIDVCAEIRTGDVVVMPYGYHGPTMAAPGYDLYSLNVMAGPGERAWRFTDDPAHAWIRDTWAGQKPDPRLPMTRIPRQD